MGRGLPDAGKMSLTFRADERIFLIPQQDRPM